MSMSGKNISSLATSHFNLQSVATELASWRKNKKFPSEPIPKFLKEQIYHLVNSNQYKILQIIKTLGISRYQIKAIENSIKADFTKNDTQELTSKSSLAKRPNLDPELLPFELLPKNNTTENPKKTDINCQSNQIKNNNSKSSSNNIVINKGSGDNLYLPINLSEDIIYKIVQLFLCSK